MKLISNLIFSYNLEYIREQKKNLIIVLTNQADIQHSLSKKPCNHVLTESIKDQHVEDLTESIPVLDRSFTKTRASNTEPARIITTTVNV